MMEVELPLLCQGVQVHSHYFGKLGLTGFWEGNVWQPVSN